MVTHFTTETTTSFAKLYFCGKSVKRKTLALLGISQIFTGDPEVGPDRSRLREDSAFFFRTRIRSQKFGKKRTQIRCHFSISAVAGVCVVIS